jgi:hypothetical protein
MLLSVDFLVAFFCVCAVWLTVLTYRMRVHSYKNRMLERTNRNQLRQIEALKNKLYGKEKQAKKDQTG